MLVLAQDDGGGGLGALLIGTVIPLLIALLVVAGVWKTFAKAGKPGWACIIPIYNVIVMLEIAGKPIWWLILFFIPFVNIIVAILVPIEIAKAFGKGAGFGLGLAFLGFIFYPILGFGDATYTAPAPAT
ncbi:MAG: signal peptidase I [Planctomycetaceae bacterium]|nr:signal peptidase I [Planctomycetaceae bacterium]